MLVVSELMGSRGQRRF